jgi:hypothetical protein
MTKETPTTLQEWEDFLFNALTAAQNSNLSDLERDILLEFVNEHTPLIIYGPLAPSQELEREDPSESTGYRTERREADHEDDVPF